MSSSQFETVYLQLKWLQELKHVYIIKNELINVLDD